MVTETPTPRLRIALILLLLCLSLTSWATTISTRVDRNPVYLGETFTLSFTASESVDDPDFRSLEKLFSIRGRNRSSEFSYTNGKMQRSTTWSLTLTAKEVGTFTIPPIAFGKVHSRPTVITVLTAPAAKDTDDSQDVILEAKIDDAAPYVQAQTTLTVRVLHAVGISNASLSEPEVSNGDAVIERLGDDRSYETQQGRRHYAVIERRYALFPQHSGALTVEPLRLEARKNRPTRSDSLFNDLFRQQLGPDLHLASKAIELTVKAIPSAYTGGQWLPAQGLELLQQWPSEPPRFHVGEPVTRTLKLSALGQTSAQLPEIGAAPTVDWKVYPDQPAIKQQVSGDLIVSERVEKLALIPTRPGTLTLPGVEIHWWNTRTNRQETARIPSREVQVMPAIQHASEPVAPLTSATDTLPATLSTPPSPPGIPLWMWLLTGLLGTGWAATAVAWWWQQTRPLHKAEAPVQAAQAEKQLRLACRRNDPRAAHQALLAWAASRGPEYRRVGLAPLGAELPPPLREEIEKLQQQLYAADPGNWQGESLWRSFEASRPALASTAARDHPESGLEPLYRH